jgi:hypothetical protein
MARSLHPEFSKLVKSTHHPEGSGKLLETYFFQAEGDSNYEIISLENFSAWILIS